MVFDCQPVLASELLRLRPLVASDFDDLYQIARDPLLWEQHPSKDRTDPSAFRRWFDQALSHGALVAVDTSTGKVIGTSRYALHDNEAVEIGWTFLARSRWGGKWNAEMKRLMLDHAFASVPTVVFTVHEENRRSQRAVERLGAVRVCTSPDAEGRGSNVVFHLRRDHSMTGAVDLPVNDTAEK